MLPHRQDGYPSHRNHVPRLRSTEGSERRQTPAIGCIVPTCSTRPPPLAGGGLPDSSVTGLTGSRTPPSHAATGTPRLSTSQQKRRFPDVATGQFCSHHNAIQVDRRLPYALHRQNGTVPAVRRLSCQVSRTDHRNAQRQVALPHFRIYGFPHRRNSVFDHFRKWCYTEKRNSA
jgi:hypothetical protein